jgi:L-cysteine:1D-myo-inositol 2-amino-2-deoxy-alpha-D-glucopyranoside ligase
LHAPLVSYGGTKMSKSLGNLVFVSDLLKEWEPTAIRLAVLAHHYRTPWDWTDDLMVEAAARLERWRAAAASAGERATEGDGAEAALDAVRGALDDDLDTPAALAAIDKAATSRRPIVTAAALLGVSL